MFASIYRAIDEWAKCHGVHYLKTIVLDIAHCLEVYLRLAEKVSSNSTGNDLFRIFIPYPFFLSLYFFRALMIAG
jgi:hypothetical protein